MRWFIQFKKKFAFTLAEVLITLGIIGIIAAIVIPALYSAYQEHVNYTALRKTYATITIAVSKLVYESGGKLTKAAYPTDELLFSALSQHIAFVKTCNGVNIKGDCWNDAGVNRFDTGAPLYTDAFWFNGNASGGVLADGTMLIVYGVFQCDDSVIPTGVPECARLLFDVNGAKKPNTLGKDIFEINLKQTKLSVGSDYSAAETSTYGGTGFGMTGYCLTNKCPK